MFLYTNNKISEKEVNNDIDNNPQNKKIVRNKFKEVKDLYTENYNTLKKETKEDINKWKNILCSWIGRINIIKISIQSNANYRFNAIPIKIPMAVFTGLEQTILMFVKF